MKKRGARGSNGVRGSKGYAMGPHHLCGVKGSKRAREARVGQVECHTQINGIC